MSENSPKTQIVVTVVYTRLSSEKQSQRESHLRCCKKNFRYDTNSKKTFMYFHRKEKMNTEFKNILTQNVFCFVKSLGFQQKMDFVLFVLCFVLSAVLLSNKITFNALIFCNFFYFISVTIFIVSYFYVFLRIFM